MAMVTYVAAYPIPRTARKPIFTIYSKRSKTLAFAHACSLYNFFLSLFLFRDIFRKKLRRYKIDFTFLNDKRLCLENGIMYQSN